MAWSRRLFVAVFLFSATFPFSTQDASALPRPTVTLPGGHLTTAASPSTSPTVSCVDSRSRLPIRFQAQHILNYGVVDSDWSPDSSSLCLGSMEGPRENVVSDAEGGVFVGWIDERIGEGDIYLQRFTSSGEVVSGWPEGGLAVCRAPLSQYGLRVTSDGSGGVFLAWLDFRQGGAGNIFVQHIAASGEPMNGWPENGRELCPQLTEQSGLSIAADGSGGLFVVWQDRRSGTLDIYAQRLDASGALAPEWPAEGFLLDGGPGHQVAPTISSDNFGRATVAWRSENGAAGMSLKVARLLPSAAPTPEIQVLELVQSATVITDPVICASTDGALIAWSQWQEGQATVRAQRLAEGIPAGGWPPDGRVLASSALAFTAPLLISDGAGGAIVAWEDLRNAGGGDLYAQRIDASGNLAQGWAPSGMPVCTSPGIQYAASLFSDGTGGAVAIWSDDLSSFQAESGSLTATGIAAHIQLGSSSARPGHAHLVWHIDPGIATSLNVQRRIQDEDWHLLMTVSPDDSGHVVVDDRNAPDGKRVEYRLSILGEGFTYNLQPVALDIPRAPDRLTLHRAWLTESHNTIAASLALPRGAALNLELLDIAGRRVSSLSLTGLEPGEQTVRMSTPMRLASGVYFVRAQQGPQSRVAKIVVIR